MTPKIIMEHRTWTI